VDTVSALFFVARIPNLRVLVVVVTDGEMNAMVLLELPNKQQPAIVVKKYITDDVDILILLSIIMIFILILILSYLDFDLDCLVN